jgi:hypothetical protein
MRIDVDASRFPVPELLRAALVVIGCTHRGRSEKTAWEVAFFFEDYFCVIGDKKFGVSITVSGASPDSGSDASTLEIRIFSALSTLVERVERDLLTPWIRAEGTSARFAIENHANELRATCEYFKTTAKNAFAGSGRLADTVRARYQDVRVEAEPRNTVMFDHYLHQASNREGGMNAGAMVNAYFSYLEHFMTLALPFVKSPESTIDLKKFLGDRWAKKFKLVYDINRDSTAKIVYDGLHHVAETYRNPLDHGGYDKRGSSLRINLDQVGWIPLQTSGLEKSVAFGVHPVEAPDFDEIVTIIEKCDSLLAGQPQGRASRWIEMGYTVFFDDEERQNYCSPDEDFERFLERRGEEMDLRANMDW